MGVCVSAPEPFNEDEVDETHFNILKRIGEGGFGAVNLVFHKGSETMMASKRMNKCKVLQSKTELKTVWMERNLLAEFDCFSLPRLLFAYQTEEEIFLIMSLMRGGDLLWYLQTHGPMKYPMAQYYAAEIFVGLEHLKELKIVWRDLKPQNLLFDDEGHIKLTDFGLAVRLEEKRGWMTKGRAGTRGYMSPQVEAREKYNYCADIFSFGVTLREMINDAGANKPDFRDIYSRLTANAVADRIGCGESGYDEIMDHPFFKDMEWHKVRVGRHGNPPFKPDLTKINADEGHALNEALVDLDMGGDNRNAEYDRELTAEDHAAFENFQYNTKPHDRHLDNIRKINGMSTSAVNELQEASWKSGRKTSILGTTKDGNMIWTTRKRTSAIMADRLSLKQRIEADRIVEE